MERYWVPHPEYVFAPCALQNLGDKEVTFKDNEEQVVNIPVAKLPELPKVFDAQLLGVDDICTLEEVNQALERYRSCNDSMELPPHIYSVGLDAVSGLRRGDGKNQAVLISGESGAGKTESTKLVLSFISEALSGTDSGPGIQDKIMQTNPVLESFGNAMTVRNNNSSRFGKWLQMTVSASLAIESCTVTDYLLELTRVCSQGSKERNYHIFFQLIEARESAELKSLGIMEPKDYAYLRGCLPKAPGIDDARFFEELKDAFQSLGIDSKLQLEVFGIVAGILVMGNIEFSEAGDAAQLVDEAPVKKASELLGVELEALKGALLKRMIKVGKDVTMANRTKPQAKAASDAMARLLYGRLFKWLIKCINTSLSDANAKKSGQFFGVLDIAGFESFEQNSLEQLFINLSNEHLQQHFNNHIFKMELDDYKAEGVNVGDGLSFNDNSDIVTLIDSKGGILSVLDEEVAMPKATDTTFLNKVFKAHEKNARLIVPKITGGGKFGIRHFAGDVTYLSEGFLEKNVDKPPDEAGALLSDSSLSVLKQIGATIVEELAEAAGAGGGKKKAKTVSSGFRSSLASLVQKLNEADPHFITKLKSILSAGSQVEKAKLFVEALPEALKLLGGVADGDVVLGKSKIFAKQPVMIRLDKARDMAVSTYSIDIQRRWRGNRVRKMLATCTVVFDELKAWCANNDFYQKPGSSAVKKHKTPEKILEEVTKLDAIFKKAEGLPLQVPRKKEVEKLKQKMQNEATAIQQIKGIAKTINPIEIEEAFVRAKEFELMDMPEVSALKSRLEKLTQQLPLVKAIQTALDEEDLEKLQEVMDAVKALDLHHSPEEWIRELNGEELAGRVYDNLEKLKAKRKQEDIRAKQKEEAKQQVFDQQKKQEAKFEVDEEAEKKKKLKERKSRATITGFTEEDQQKVLMSLLAACHEFDFLALEKGLHTAAENKIEACDTLDKAKELLEKMSSEASLVAMLRELQEQLKHDHSAEIFKRLQNVLNRGKELNIDQEAISSAKDCMQSGVRQRARKTLKGNVFVEMANMEEVELVEKAFSDLSAFEGLKTPQEWKGHKKASLLAAAENRELTMLRHSKLEIRDALTKVPSSEVRQAVSCFHSILGWMGDRPLPETQRLGFREDIAQVAKSSPTLADEIYVQVMKQLRENPSDRSMTLGWKLMLRLCQQVQPSEKLDEFVRSFIMHGVKSSNSEVEHMAKQCVADLNINAAPDGVHEGADLLPVTVLLIDHSVRKVHMPRASTLQQLKVRLAEQLRIGAVEEFACFQMTDGLETHRLLPESTPLSMLEEKWAKLKASLGRASHLVFKRRFLSFEETLNPGDLTHATLTYRQVVWDYLHYPVPEAEDTIKHIAAAILHLEFEHYKQYIASRRLDDPTILQQLVPQVSLRNRQFRMWSNKILEAFDKLQLEGGSREEPRLMRMSRVLDKCKMMQLFGAHHWLGRQVESIPPEKAALPQAPEKNCPINRKQKEGEYWICVDLFGVRFVTADSQPGQSFSRGFLFNEETLERVYCCKAKGNIVQIVVKTVDPENPQAGRVNQTITMVCPAAVDVAFCAHTVQELYYPREGSDGLKVSMIDLVSPARESRAAHS
eukprot:CAMPEP_0181535406 /NCGR_PEP_ID=MMETSP1110-20121109/74238_1 /TAXON_ID=174948 /ORGANISM="Symbiodinium sp., Strain CCMP421" /LENGTH=1595 /DNA_ID=CAMNT_0023666783 /DNA_START=55 /DNA_END=4840 /DNA_ORIENTATION=+